MPEDITLYAPWNNQISLQKATPAYPYVQYQDDDDVRAFFDSFNIIAQRYLNTFNTLNLPVYTSSTITGSLLDWVAQGLYGMTRPVLPSGSSIFKGPLETYGLAENVPLADYQIIASNTFYNTTDDVFKRCMTWNFYKGDGPVFDIRWLKRRIMRFLIGVNGTAPPIDNTDQISITFGLGNQININIIEGATTVTGGAIFGDFGLADPEGVLASIESNSQEFPPFPLAPIFVAAIQSGALQLPFQFTYVVTIDGSGATTFLDDDGGVLLVSDAAGYPSSSSGLSPGAVYSNGGGTGFGAVAVVPGVTPNPIAPPIFFGSVTAASLQSLGGGNLPLIAGTTGSGQLYNNGGEVAIS